MTIDSDHLISAFQRGDTKLTDDLDTLLTAGQGQVLDESLSQLGDENGELWRIMTRTASCRLNPLQPEAGASLLFIPLLRMTEVTLDDERLAASFHSAGMAPDGHRLAAMPVLLSPHKLQTASPATIRRMLDTSLNGSHGDICGMGSGPFPGEPDVVLCALIHVWQGPQIRLDPSSGKAARWNTLLIQEQPNLQPLGLPTLLPEALATGFLRFHIVHMTSWIHSFRHRLCGALDAHLHHDPEKGITVALVNDGVLLDALVLPAHLPYLDTANELPSALARHADSLYFHEHADDMPKPRFLS
jgi:hypothetical protein